MPTLTGGLDWEPGPWLSSWESSLPPNPPRYFNLDGFDGRTWLLTGEKAPEDIVENDDFWADSGYDNAAEIAKNLVACWPNPPAEIAKCAGITLRELQWFTSGKAPLDRYTRLDLEDLLGIEYDESMGGYVGAGPYVLMAHKSLSLKEVYEAISKGGDARPCEIVPRQAAADPSWRYVLINTYGEPPSIVMSPRGAKKQPAVFGGFRLTQNPNGITHRGFAVSEVFTPAYTAQHISSNSPFPKLSEGVRGQQWKVRPESRNCPLRILRLTCRLG